VTVRVTRAFTIDTGGPRLRRDPVEQRDKARLDALRALGIRRALEAGGTLKGDHPC